ncbi:hypothetical protein RRG08_054681 [Elysia crispata]|uniref:Uncharacterized protein n=1 Tax=Elysia crispata TaxID=231223 RepID=A0AAE1E8A7_9GAST|nr:hypothetical protein RRG08_054681 [Elysia crispata]
MLKRALPVPPARIKCKAGAHMQSTVVKSYCSTRNNFSTEHRREQEAFITHTCMVTISAFSWPCPIIETRLVQFFRCTKRESLQLRGSPTGNDRGTPTTVREFGSPSP